MYVIASCCCSSRPVEEPKSQSKLESVQLQLQVKTSACNAGSKSDRTFTYSGCEARVSMHTVASLRLQNLFVSVGIIKKLMRAHAMMMMIIII